MTQAFTPAAEEPNTLLATLHQMVRRNPDLGEQLRASANLHGAAALLQLAAQAAGQDCPASAVTACVQQAIEQAIEQALEQTPAPQDPAPARSLPTRVVGEAELAV